MPRHWSRDRLHLLSLSILTAVSWYSLETNASIFDANIFYGNSSIIPDLIPTGEFISSKNDTFKFGKMSIQSGYADILPAVCQALSSNPKLPFISLSSCAASNYIDSMMGSLQYHLSLRYPACKSSSLRLYPTYDEFVAASVPIMKIAPFLWITILFDGNHPDTPAFLQAFMNYNWVNTSLTMAKLHPNMAIFNQGVKLKDQTEKHLYIALPTLDENFLINQIKLSRSKNKYVHWMLFFPRMSSYQISSRLPEYTPLIILGDYPTKDTLKRKLASTLTCVVAESTLTSESFSCANISTNSTPQTVNANLTDCASVSIPITATHEAKNVFRSVGQWRKGSLSLTTKYDKQVWNKRRSLNGIMLKIGYIENQPYVFTPKGSDSSQPVGLCVDFINLLSKRMHFNYTMIKMVGSPNTVTWNALLKQVENKTYDMLTCDYFVTADRDKVVDFTSAWMDSWLGIVIKKPIDQSMFRFLTPFEWKSWIAIAAAIFAIGVITYLVSSTSPLSMWNLGAKERVSDEVSIVENTWSIFGALMQQGHEFYPYAVSTRVVVVFWWIFTVVINSSYTADLVAALTVNTVYPPITSLAEIPGTSFGTIIFKGSATEAFFKRGKGLYRKIYMSENYKTIKLSQNPISMINDSYSMAYIDDTDTLKYKTKDYCDDFMILPDRFHPVSLAFPLQKKSPYKELFDEYIMQLFEKGVVHKLKTNWWKKNRLCQKQRTNEGLRFTQTAGVFIATGGFYVVGLVILILEVMASIFCRKRKDKAYLHKSSTSNTTICTIESNASFRDQVPIGKENRPSTTETHSDDTGVYSQASSTEITNGNR